jgi:hypothetical protein
MNFHWITLATVHIQSSKQQYSSINLSFFGNTYLDIPLQLDDCLTQVKVATQNETLSYLL